jgi:hypothetical protein
LTHEFYRFDTLVDYIQLQDKIFSKFRAMKPQRQHKLIKFLVEELAIPTASIKLALDRSQENITVLPMILWQYGLINLRQLEKIWDWTETI